MESILMIRKNDQNVFTSARKSDWYKNVHQTICWLCRLSFYDVTWVQWHHNVQNSFQLWVTDFRIPKIFEVEGNLQM